MITKAIIEEMMYDGYRARIRIPIFHKIKDVPGSTPFNELPKALINYAPGCKPNFSVGDVVYVAFENNQASEPVIIGALFKGEMDISCSLFTDSIVYRETEYENSDGVMSSQENSNIINNKVINNYTDLTDEEYYSLLAQLIENSTETTE